jgi:hypothetical protein
MKTLNIYRYDELEREVDKKHALKQIERDYMKKKPKDANDVIERAQEMGCVFYKDGKIADSDIIQRSEY